MAGTWTVAVMPTTSSPRILRIWSLCHSGVGKPVQTVALKDDVRQDAVESLVGFGREAGHHRVDDDQRGHTQRHADDRGQGDVASAEIPPREKEFVHGQSFGCESIRGSDSRLVVARQQVVLLQVAARLHGRTSSDGRCREIPADPRRIRCADRHVSRRDAAAETESLRESIVHWSTTSPAGRYRRPSRLPAACRAARPG